MKLQALTLVLCLSSARGLIDCRTACRSCRTAKEPPELLNILCAMCEECKARRRERLAGNQNSALANKAPPPPSPPVSLETRQPAPWRESPRYITEALRYITEHRKYISEDPLNVPAEPNLFDQNRVLPQDEAPAPQGCPQPPACPDNTVLETLPPCMFPPPPQPTTTTTTTTAAPATCPPVTDCVKRNPPCSSCCMPMIPCFIAPCPQIQITAPATTTRRYIDVYVGIPTDAKLRKNFNLRKGEHLPVSNVFNTRLRHRNELDDRKKT